MRKTDKRNKINELVVFMHQTLPIPLCHPGGRFGWVSPVCPVTEFFPGEKVQPPEDGFAHHRAIIVRPAPDFGVELADQLALRQGFTASTHPPELRQMLLDVGLGGFDQGFEAQVLAITAFARLVFAHPILPDVVG